MTDTNNLGVLNGHHVGWSMKEFVRRAIIEIRSQRFAFEVYTKAGYSPGTEDVFTSTDTAAQHVYVRPIREAFPGWGIVAEERALVVPSTNGLYFSIDPLCGTKAWIRRQSHGIGTMLSLCSEGEFLAAYIGDVNTQEIYGFRPGSNKVHRISEFSANEDLDFKPQILKSQYVLLRDPDYHYSEFSQKFIRLNFKNQLVDGGSIGIWFARLWKREVGALLLLPGTETPWDANPVNAISLKLGFVFLKPSPEQDKWIQFTPLPQSVKTRRDYEVLVVHKSNLEEVLDSEGNERWLREKAEIEAKHFGG